MRQRILAVLLVITMVFTLGESSQALAAGEDSSPDNEEIINAQETEGETETKENGESPTVVPEGNKTSEPDADSEITIYDETEGDQGSESGVSGANVMVSLSKTTLNMAKDMTATLTATVEDTDNQAVTWSSSDETVATVSDGKVTAKKDGNATITATPEETGQAATCKVTVDTSDGFHQDPDSGDWYYYLNGKVATDISMDVIKDTKNQIDNTQSWWYVHDGKVTKGETVARNSNGWWYINPEGRVDFNYKGFAKNNNGWWYLENGKVSFSKNSVIKDTGKKIDGNTSWWYVVGSKVQTSYTGLADYSNENGWWYISNGKVTFNVTTVAKNKNGWWYVDGSQVQFKYNGFAKNSNGWWYIEKGKVTFKRNDVLKDTGKKIDGTASWWYVVGSKVQTGFTGLANYKNENGWWYIKDGKVDFTYNGTASNVNGTWYLENGQVNFNYNGTVKISNMLYMATNGKIDVGVSSSMYNKAQSKSSSTKYLVMIDTSACRLGVFQGSKGNWASLKFWKCSPGKPSTKTPKGTWKIQDKGRYFNGKTYTCWWYSRFHNGCLIHSVLYQKGSMTKIRDGRLGMQLSHGCVRLQIDNAKWVYDNVTRGTTVYIY